MVCICVLGGGGGNSSGSGSRVSGSGSSSSSRVTPFTNEVPDFAHCQCTCCVGVRVHQQALQQVPSNLNG
jgi:hypothetical protein